VGTRYLASIKHNGQYIAQYGSMGGHPENAGGAALSFIRKIYPDSVELFKSKLKNIKLVDESLCYEIEMPVILPAYTVYNAIYNSEEELKLYDKQIEFAASFSCDWVYVLDFDTNQFKVYKGQNKSIELEEKDFAPYLSDDEASLGYRAAGLHVAYDFDKLPDDKTFNDLFIETNLD